MKITTPKHLKGESKDFFESVVTDFEIEPHHQKLLIMACDCLTRINDARKVVDKAGSTYTDKFGQPKMHPGVKVEIDNKTLFARLIRELQLNIELPDDTRIPRLVVK